MFYPSLSEFKNLAKKYNLIPVYKEIIADADTPVSTFLKLTKKEKYAYLLESVEGGEFWGRYSFISWAPKLIFKSHKNHFSVYDPHKNKYIEDRQSNNPLDELKKYVNCYKPADIQGLPRFFGGAVGYIGYEMVHNFEKIPRPEKDELNLPDSIFLLNDIIVIFDHLLHKTKIVICVDLTKNTSIDKLYNNACEKIDRIISNFNKTTFLGYKRYKPEKNLKYYDIKSDVTKQEFISRVRKAKEYIYAGDIIQVVLSQRFRKKTVSHPFEIYRALRTINPSPYMYYINFDKFQLIGSSPEILVRKEGKVAETRPIAGTRPRTNNESEDKKYEMELVNSIKEKAEHIMLVDLGRNDLGVVCKYGTVKVEQLMTVEKYSHVMHMVSSVKGKLKDTADSFSLLRACFPAGTVSGAPKIRAMEIISELENTVRGPYSGAVGYFSYNGNMDTAINIRTILYKNKVCYVQTGAGIVADSVPEKEYLETKNKAQALFVAIEQSERGYL
jgi:anthranilate synthase component 1